MATGIDIVNFNSSGVYFQNLGTVKIGIGRLQYVNLIDLPEMERFSKYLIANLNSYGNSTANTHLVQKMIEDIDEVKLLPIPVVDSFRSEISLSNMRSKVQDFVRVTNSTIDDLQKNKKPTKDKMLAIKSKFDEIIGVIKQTDFNEILLSLPDFKKRFKNLRIPGDAQTSYRKLKEITTVTKSKSSRNMIFISLDINFVDEQAFNLWKLIALPMIKDRNVVTLQNNYRFMLTSHDTFLATTSAIESLSQNNILSANHVLRELSSESCLVGIFNGIQSSMEFCNFNSTFDNIEIFQHLGYYRYLFAIRDKTKYTFTCPGMVHNLGDESYIQGTGILTLNEDCTFKTEDTDITAIKADVVIEPKDKFQFTEIFDRITETLNARSVIKKAPILTPLTKITSNFEDLYESRRKMDEYGNEIGVIMERLNNRTMPARRHWWSFD